MPMKSVLFSTRVTNFCAVGLGAFAVGDVDADRRQKQHPARVVSDRLNRDIGHALAAVGDEVRQLGAERLPRGRLARRGLDLLHELRRRRPPRTFPERLADDLFRREAAAFPRQAIRLEERAVHVHDAGKQRPLLEERAELGVGRRRFCQQLALALLGLPLAGDVPHDLRRADDTSGVVLDRRDRERHEDAPAVGAHALGFEMLDPLPGFQAGDDVVFLGDALGRDDEGDVAADRLLGRVAEQTFGRGVPALDRCHRATC